MRTILAYCPSRGTGRTVSCIWTPVFLALCALQTTPAAAQEIRWRTDYNQARKEAQDRDLPIMLEFATENCHWCRRLEATTFRHESIVGLVNDRFVALKVDADKQQSLTEALHIHSYPTLVLAGADGKIIATLEGYLDATRLQEQLHRVLAIVANPDWMTQDYQEATKAIQRGDLARAIALFRSIVEDGKERPVQVKALQNLKDMEKQATERLTQARKKEGDGNTAEAIESLTDLVRTFPGTPAATEGGRMLAHLTSKPQVSEPMRSRRAQELIAQAREDLRNQQYLGCLDRCEQLSRSFADLPEAEEARKLALEIRSNPEWLQQACDGLTERLGSLYLSMAENWMRKGQVHRAISCYERVMLVAPGSRHADLAQAKLAPLKNPARTVSIDKKENKKD